MSMGIAKPIPLPSQVDRRVDADDLAERVEEADRRCCRG